MGEPWMMPTKTQLEELIKYTTSEWTSIYRVNGRKFISKSDNSKYIFLPATGLYTSNTVEPNSYGRYWSTKYNETYTYDACQVYFESSGDLTIYYNSRYSGNSIKPVAPKRPW